MSIIIRKEVIISNLGVHQKVKTDINCNKTYYIDNQSHKLILSFSPRLIFIIVQKTVQNLFFEKSIWYSIPKAGWQELDFITWFQIKSDCI